MVGAIFELVEELKHDGSTILLVEQNARRTLAAADRTYVMQNGSLRMETSGAEADIAEVERQYLGVDTAPVA
jgi:branched-chain amino acid transport system ATP-binding protein